MVVGRGHDGQWDQCHGIDSLIFNFSSGSQRFLEVINRFLGVINIQGHV